MTRTKLNLDLQGLDGNAFALIAHFQRTARRSGWTQEEIKDMTNELTAGTYQELLNKLMTL